MSLKDDIEAICKLDLATQEVAYSGTKAESDIIRECQKAWPKAVSVIERLRANQEWRPIKTAPIGELILVWLSEPIRDGGKLTHVNTEIWDGKKLFAEKIFGYKATHWMPLPQAPKEAV